MNNYTEAVANALDHAIAKVARAEFRRLIRLQGKEKAARGIETALRGLEGLQGGAMPEYDDDWLPVLYSTWYQPSHVNLAYSMITTMAKWRDSKRRVLAPNGRLHVFDFGCGTLAMQFGVALAVVDALQRGQKFTAVWVELIDSSQKMIAQGKKIWRQFKAEVSRNPHLDRLSEACDLIHSNIFEEYNPPLEDERWLSAMHVAYRANQDEIENGLTRLRNGTDADVGFITYAPGSDSRKLALSVSPFRRNRKYRPSLTGHRLLLQDQDLFLETSDVRHELLEHIDLQHVEDYGFVRNYLWGDPQWDRPKVRFLIYTRR